jgi:hypothetical protein
MHCQVVGGICLVQTESCAGQTGAASERKTQSINTSLHVSCLSLIIWSHWSLKKYRHLFCQSDETNLIDIWSEFLEE